mgnify:CR=1 FL=1
MSLLVDGVSAADLCHRRPDLIRLIFKIRGCQPDAAGNLTHIAFHQASGGNGRGADADAGGNKGASGVIGNGIFIQCNAYLITAVLKLFSGNIQTAQVNQHQMIVRTVG